MERQPSPVRQVVDHRVENCDQCLGFQNKTRAHEVADFIRVVWKEYISNHAEDWLVKHEDISFPVIADIEGRLQVPP